MKNYTYEDINIVFEDNKVIVAVKPQNIPSQEDSTGDMDMLRLIKEYRKINENKPGDAYVGLVHRLDRPTGGLMVFAKNSKAAAYLQSQMINGIFKKSYYAVVRGIPEKVSGTLKDYLVKDTSKNIVRVCTRQEYGAKEAILTYTTVATYAKKDVALLKIDLETGRPHQIRVQMAHMGNPLFGDLKYGADKNADIKDKKLNLALYATDIKFKDLNTNENLFFRVLPPKEDVPWNLFDINILLGIDKYDEY